jgi:hypothetical protein
MGELRLNVINHPLTVEFEASPPGEGEKANESVLENVDICTRFSVGIEVVVVVFKFLLPKRAPLIQFLICRVSRRCPNTSRFIVGWRSPKS